MAIILLGVADGRGFDLGQGNDDKDRLVETKKNMLVMLLLFHRNVWWKENFPKTLEGSLPKRHYFRTD